LISPVNYLTTILGMPTDESQAIVDDTVDELLKEAGMEEETNVGIDRQTKVEKGRDNKKV